MWFFIHVICYSGEEFFIRKWVIYYSKFAYELVNYTELLTHENLLILLPGPFKAHPIYGVYDSLFTGFVKNYEVRMKMRNTHHNSI